ncbi:hypothetical protein C8Q77DRAFT_1109395 [Trametes polyzona]|nr:hypothetical protein C8Q77DRAFT_1109395 [Trametes polyzona]
MFALTSSVSSLACVPGFLVDIHDDSSYSVVLADPWRTPWVIHVSTASQSKAGLTLLDNGGACGCTYDRSRSFLDRY